MAWTYFVRREPGRFDFWPKRSWSLGFLAEATRVASIFGRSDPGRFDVVILFVCVIGIVLGFVIRFVITLALVLALIILVVFVIPCVFALVSVFASARYSAGAQGSILAYPFGV